MHSRAAARALPHGATSSTLRFNARGDYLRCCEPRMTLLDFEVVLAADLADIADIGAHRFCEYFGLSADDFESVGRQRLDRLRLRQRDIRRLVDAIDHRLRRSRGSYETRPRIIFRGIAQLLERRRIREGEPPLVAGR